MLRDRAQAGCLLAALLMDYPHESLTVVSLAGGGVMVGRAIADTLGVPLDVLVLEPIASSHDPDLPLGWVTARGTTSLDHKRLRHQVLPAGFIAVETERKREIAEEREYRLRCGAPRLSLIGRAVVLATEGVDDEAQAVTALKDLRQRSPAWLVLAAPVIVSQPQKRLTGFADATLVLHSLTHHGMVGQEYRDFPPVDEVEIMAMLRATG